MQFAEANNIFVVEQNRRFVSKAIDHFDVIGYRNYSAVLVLREEGQGCFKSILFGFINRFAYADEEFINRAFFDKRNTANELTNTLSQLCCFFRSLRCDGFCLERFNFFIRLGKVRGT